MFHVNLNIIFELSLISLLLTFDVIDGLTVGSNNTVTKDISDFKGNNSVIIENLKSLYGRNSQLSPRKSLSSNVTIFHGSYQSVYCASSFYSACLWQTGLNAGSNECSFNFYCDTLTCRSTNSSFLFDKVCEKKVGFRFKSDGDWYLVYFELNQKWPSSSSRSYILLSSLESYKTCDKYEIYQFEIEISGEGSIGPLYFPVESPGCTDFGNSNKPTSSSLSGWSILGIVVGIIFGLYMLFVCCGAFFGDDTESDDRVKPERAQVAIVASQPHQNMYQAPPAQYRPQSQQSAQYNQAQDAIVAPQTHQNMYQAPPPQYRPQSQQSAQNNQYVTETLPPPPAYSFTR